MTDELVPGDDRIIGRVFRLSLLAILLVAAVVAALYWLLRDRPQPVEEIIERGAIVAPERLRGESKAMPEVRFVDVTRESGILFKHENGARGLKLLPETMGAGAAFLDYDGDGDQDLLLVNSMAWPGDEGEATPQALYRNDGDGRFDDVTREAGLSLVFYGQGVAVGDYDGDGRVDLFITALGRNRLFRNVGGRFEETTELAGVAGEPTDWHSSAGFFDYDRDGDLDLFVCNYVRWSREIDLRLNFTLNGVDRAYGPPNQYGGSYSTLYRNEGEGRFLDVSEAAGIRVDSPLNGQPAGKALAVTFADVDADGWLDILVANDTVQNFAFRNRGDGTFEDLGSVSGFGFDGTGSATGAMGIDAADFSNEGRLGVGIGNFANEATSFYVQQERPWQFVDMSDAHGIGSPSRLKLSFGLFFFDYDLDGRLDLLQANGHLEHEINEIQPSQHYHQAAQLFRNEPRGSRTRFVAVPDDRVGDLSRPIVGRGAAYADIDADGDLDVLLTQAGAAPLLLRNDQRTGHHWLRVELEGGGSNRSAIGATVVLVAGGTTQRRSVMPTRSYLSQVELPVTFGLGEADEIESLSVTWPDGRVQPVTVEQVDTVLRVRPSP